MDSVQKRDRDRKRRQQAEEDEIRRRQKVADRRDKARNPGFTPVVAPSSETVDPDAALGAPPAAPPVTQGVVPPVAKTVTRPDAPPAAPLA